MKIKNIHNKINLSSLKLKNKNKNKIKLIIKRNGKINTIFKVKNMYNKYYFYNISNNYLNFAHF